MIGTDRHKQAYKTGPPSPTILIVETLSSSSDVQEEKGGDWGRGFSNFHEGRIGRSVQPL